MLQVIMRKWMRERMKRRAKKQPNESESTGKVGQQLNPNQPAPLQPSYADAKDYGDKHGYTASDEADGEAEDQDLGDGEDFEGVATGKTVVETQPDSPSTPPAGPEGALQQNKAQRVPRGVVVLAIGLPGSGKTTWFKRRGVTPLSSDMLRSILFDDITEQRYQGLVFSTLRSLLRARLIAKMPWNYVDATNLSPHERRQWIKMARGLGYEVQAVFFDVPLEICLDRNRKRERQVSEDIMTKMAEKLRPPSFKEGFSKIVVVRVKQTGAGPEVSL